VVLVSDPNEIAAVADAIARSPLVAFDVEFVSQDRLVPVLCLIQVAWLDEHTRLDAPGETIVAAKPAIRLVDPIGGDVGPVVRALEAHPLVVSHAPRQDLAILAARFPGGSEPLMPGLIDTQLMAAFAGHGDQVGLATLAQELLGIALAKDMQWTAWQTRPLTPAQLVYAEADVRHLPALYARLAAKLGPRVAWVKAETAQVAADAVRAATVTPEIAWKQLGTRGLDPAAMAAVVELAAWRQRVAVELDRPLGQVLAEKLILDLARQRPSNPGGVRSLKGLSPLARTRADEIVAALAAAAHVAPGPRPLHRGASPRAQRWAETLLSIVQVIAEEAQIAPRLLATRADAEEFARVVDEQGLASTTSLPALASWRRDVLGTAWTGWLSGELVLVGDTASPQGVKLVPRVM
jgi:ribonuclease D